MNAQGKRIKNYFERIILKKLLFTFMMYNVNRKRLNGKTAKVAKCLALCPL